MSSYPHWDAYPCNRPLSQSILWVRKPSQELAQGQGRNKEWNLNPGPLAPDTLLPAGPSRGSMSLDSPGALTGREGGDSARAHGVRGLEWHMDGGDPAMNLSQQQHL